MKSKMKLLSLLFLVSLLVEQAPPMESTIVESKVKSLVVERRLNAFDLFTVNMKANHKCTVGTDVDSWCKSLGAHYYAYWSNLSSCSCTCSTYQPYTFLSSIQKCANAAEVASFGRNASCPEYFDEQNLLAYPDYPVDLKEKTTFNKQFALDKKSNCSLSGDYYVHDYSDFHGRWQTTKNDGFFKIVMARNKQRFDIKWLKDTNDTLSGRIIRLSVTCNSHGQAVSFTRCILLKAKGTVTYFGPLATNTGHPSISNLPVSSHVPLLSATMSLVTKSSSLLVSLAVSPPPPSSSSSSSLLQPSSVSLPPSFTSMLSSPAPAPAPSSSSFSYQLPSASVSSSSPTLLPSPSSVSTSSTGTSSFLPLTQSQTARLPVLTSGQIQAATSAVIVPIKPAETTKAVSSSSAPGSGPGDRGTQTGGSDNGVVIGAAVGGAVVLGVSVIIFIVVWKRRKAWENTEKQTKPVKNPLYGSSSNNEIQLEVPKESKTMPSVAQDNQPTYQSLINDNGPSNGAAIYSSAEDDYDNCTVYQSLDKQIPGSHVYGRLNKGLPEPAHTTGLPNLKPKGKTGAAGVPTSKANGVTGLPKPKPTPTPTGQSSDRPRVAQENVYNVLDGPGMGQGTTPEPLYNVLEGTDSGQDYETPKIDPLYNVLEVPNSKQDLPKNGPNTKQEPLYNVLEGLDANNAPVNSQDPGNDPLYNVLEGPEASHDAYESGASATREPLYNVLDSSDVEKSPLVPACPSNEPLYNVLDGPDSDGSNQGAPKEPISSEAHDNPAYEQTLEFNAPYAAVQRPGTQRESVYEPLRKPAQDPYESIG